MTKVSYDCGLLQENSRTVKITHRLFIAALVVITVAVFIVFVAV